MRFGKAIIKILQYLYCIKRYLVSFEKLVYSQWEYRYEGEIVVQLLFVVLNKPELLDELFSMFISIGISRATCLESVGMGRSISETDVISVPLFATLRKHLNESKPYNNTIFTLVPDERIDEVIDSIQKITGDMSKPGTGIIFTVPVGRVVGFPKGTVDEN